MSVLYHARWSVELLFRELKSRCELGSFQTEKPYIVRIQVLAALLTLVVSRAILRVFVDYADDRETAQRFHRNAGRRSSGRSPSLCWWISQEQAATRRRICPSPSIVKRGNQLISGDAARGEYRAIQRFPSLTEYQWWAERAGVLDDMGSEATAIASPRDARSQDRSLAVLSTRAIAAAVRVTKREKAETCRVDVVRSTAGSVHAESDEVARRRVQACVYSRFFSRSSSVLMSSSMSLKFSFSGTFQFSVP